jgi:hypothetical protein
MKGAAPAELLITLGYRRPRLVLDPWLCLDPLGPHLIQRLHGLVELWIARELWHILDNSHYFALHPRALLSDEPRWLDDYRARFHPVRERALDGEPNDALPADAERTQDLLRALAFWDGVRLASDLSGLKLFWLGDGLSESLLPEGSATTLHAAHERTAAWLDRRLQPRSPLASGQRDALALALALGGAPVLSLIDRQGEQYALPSSLTSSGVPCARIPDDDRLVGLERDSWTSLLVRANCAPLWWRGLRLALVHVYSSALDCVVSGELAEPAEGAGDVASFENQPLAIYWYGL